MEEKREKKARKREERLKRKEEERKEKEVRGGVYALSRASSPLIVIVEGAVTQGKR